MVEFCGAVGSHTFYSCLGTKSISFKIGEGTLCVCCACMCVCAVVLVQMRLNMKCYWTAKSLLLLIYGGLHQLCCLNLCRLHQLINLSSN